MTQENILAAVKAAYKALDDKLAIDIRVLEIGEISPMADYFIIASGNNPNQLKAMADIVDETLFKSGLKLSHSEGMQTKSWILLDFGEVVVHLFNKEDRDFYNLERIWADARALTDEELKA
jgi:ribosome-associated protein